jgi:hypothetical protein
MRLVLDKTGKIENAEGFNFKPAVSALKIILSDMEY